MVFVGFVARKNKTPKAAIVWHVTAVGETVLASGIFGDVRTQFLASRSSDASIPHIPRIETSTTIADFFKPVRVPLVVRPCHDFAVESKH